MNYRKLSDIEIEINSLDTELTKVSKMYELYFLGQEKFEPIRERDRLAKRIRLMQSRHVPQTSTRYKLTGLLSRFATYQAHWDRTVRKIEEGTYFRQVAKKSVSLDTIKTPVAASTQTVDRLYQDVMDLHSGSKIESLPPKHRFETFIKETRRKLIDQHGHDRFNYEVKVSEGRIKVVVREK